MKKSFLATSKKVLLATSVLVMSSTAMANTSTVLDDETGVNSVVNVFAKYITPITLALDTTVINFGDVYTDSDVTIKSVAADVQGEFGETFTYTVVATGTDGLLVLGGDTGATNVGFDADTSTAAELTFTVDLDTSKLAADTDVSESVTFTVHYDTIADTSTTANPAYVAPTSNP
ncbi:MAG: hypothetical protein ACJAYB_002608 [Psychromonas sp.]|jgi:hypothetical protein